MKLEEELLIMAIQDLPRKPGTPRWYESLQPSGLFQQVIRPKENGHDELKSIVDKHMR